MTQLKPCFSNHFQCDKCQREFRQTTSYSPLAFPRRSAETYCANCVEFKIDKRITGRIKQLNLKVKERIYWKLKKLALKEKCLMTEILEKLLAAYEKQRKK